MASQSQQLRRSFLVTGAIAATALVAAIAIVAGRASDQILERQARDRAQNLAGRAVVQVSQYLEDRRLEAERLGAVPDIARAADAASRQAVARGLDQMPAADLERAFAATRALGADPALTAFIRDYVAKSDFAEVFFTERHGLIVAASGRTSDFVQADEPWWREAMTAGVFEGEPAYDSSAAMVAMEYDVAIRARGQSRPVGVLKAAFDLGRLSQLLAPADLGENAYLQVVDDHGHLVVTPNAAQLLNELPNADRIPRTDSAAVVVVQAATGEELVTSMPTEGRRWWVVLRQPTFSAYAAARATRRAILIGAPALLALMVGVIWGVATWLNRRVTEPVRAAGRIASRVAAGDLSVTVAAPREQSGEVRELLSAVQSMVVALRRLVGAIRGAADEAAAMAAEISASTEQMSASTQEMAATSQDLARRAGEQAQVVRAAAGDAGRILEIATILAHGAEESVRRNSDVARLARHHRELLDQSSAELGRLAGEVEQGAQEAAALASASAEIQKFVTQAKAVATQTNMLALNAAIEAARAGPQGRGFAVVADEVRKLASLAAAGATETADTVRGVLARVQATRDRLVRLAQGGAAARQAAQKAAEGLETVAVQADANDAWSREIATAASDMRGLVEEIAGRLTTVAQGTDSLLASTEQLAASSEEQSASTQEIASSANQLAEAADRLTGAVKTFRLLADEPAEARQAAD